MAARVKLPENLRSWKILTRISEDNGNEIYSVSKKDYDGTVVKGILRYILIKDDEYNIDTTDFINKEADFLKSVSQSAESFNYLDISVNNNPAKKKIEFFIITEDLKTLSEVLKTKKFSDDEIVDFGIQMSSVLEKLESNGIYHGNITPDNIYVTDSGNYKLGGFSDYESKIYDMSFIAPEIFKKEDADFTTDLYSLGLIMYSMSNNGKIPFESETVSREKAIEMRYDGKSVPAPAAGNEKLKSVIVIACQSNKENRWKNAGNIKNALTSIKSEISPSTENPALIVPETTEFDGNFFEEYDYDDNSNEQTDGSSADLLEESSTTNEDPFAANDEQKILEKENINTEPIAEMTAESDNESPYENTDDSTSTNNATPDVDAVSKDETADEFSNVNVPSDQELDFNIKSREISSVSSKSDTDDSPNEKTFEETVKEKDYGSFFDDYEPISIDEKQEHITTDNKENLMDDYDVFNSEDESKNTDNKKKKNTAVIVVSIIVILAALGFIAYCIIIGLTENNDTQNNENETTKSSTQVTQAPETQASTEPQTTVAPTTKAQKAEIIQVVGYGYSYAKKLLEEDGFKVEIGEYDYSEEWPEGYVISQTPSANTEAEKGSVVTLDISLGIQEPETTAKPTDAEETKVQSSQTSSIDNSYIFSNSASSYLSQSDVDSLSDNELNLALNEIYARRGRIFKDDSIASYFDSKSWYEPKYSADEFSQNVTFNSYEQANIQLMVNEQKDRGLR